MGQLSKYLTGFLVLVAVVLSLCSGGSAIGCSRPTVGQYVYGVDGTECVALVKEKCTGLKQRTTGSWRRGIYVKDNCNSIPSLTAIATFQGPGNSYNGGSFRHAAIFIRCLSDGIEVYDQWNGSGGVRQRTLRYNAQDSNNGKYFYTIV